MLGFEPAIPWLRSSSSLRERHLIAVVPDKPNTCGLKQYAQKLSLDLIEAEKKWQAQLKRRNEGGRRPSKKDKDDRSAETSSETTTKPIPLTKIGGVHQWKMRKPNVGAAEETVEKLSEITVFSSMTKVNLLPWRTLWEGVREIRTCRYL